MEDRYVTFVGIFDQKLGPTCAAPRSQCDLFFAVWSDDPKIIQDGINTSAKMLTFRGRVLYGYGCY